jgi:hypothetical protein
MMGKLKVKSQKAKVDLKQFIFYFNLLFFNFTFLLFTLICYAQPISSTDLINNAKEYDGRLVVYTGEVIGDVMARGEYAWINVNDKKNAIGIWLPQDLTKDIFYTGNYKHQGDAVEIIGIFHRACTEHGGDLDIHAQSLRKIKAGMPAPEKSDIEKRNLIIVLAGVALLLWILSLLKRK